MVYFVFSLINHKCEILHISLNICIKLADIEFKLIESKLVGSDSVSFKLEDGHIVKVKVDIDRVGIAVNYKNPDGSPHYNVSISSKITIVSPDKKYKLPKGDLNVKDPSSSGVPYT